MHEKLAIEKAHSEGLALTFDDVRLKTGYAATMPDDVSLGSLFSRHVQLKIPITSAAMDTVTEYTLAIELAKLGGLGVIHRSLTPEEQAAQVARVKNNLNGRIEKPICVYDDQTVADVLKRRQRKLYTFHSFPVQNREGKLVGILTGNDFDFCDDPSQLIREVMTSQDLLTSPEGTTIQQAYEIMQREKRKILPLVTSDNRVAGLYIFSDVKRIMTGDAQTYNVDKNGQLLVAAAIGAGEGALSRLELLVNAHVDVVVIDTAHGDSKAVYDTLRDIKRSHGGLDVVVGNVSIGTSAKRLAEAGADGIKIGQGPGSICTTRVIAGIGRPQVSAIYDCAKAADIPLCADGGLRNSGDIPIAIAAGAHSVMMGSMLAGTEEAPGDIVFIDGRQWKTYRGMGSLGAMETNESSRERYNQQGGAKNNLIPEGVEGLVPYKGKLSVIILQHVGGLRRGMGYVGAASIKELQEKGDFDRITGAGLSESHPHDIHITKDSPNYTREENNELRKTVR